MRLPRYIYIIFLFFFSSPGKTQGLSNLPKLLPSYSDDFTHLKSYPSMCFDNAFFGRQGRLWLKPCGGARTGLPLFLFDGYEFKVEMGKLDELPANTNFVVLNNNQQLLGYTNNPDKQVVSYDLKTGEITVYNLELNEEHQIRGIALDDQDKLFVVSEIKGFFLWFELEEGRFVLRQKMEAEGQGHDFMRRPAFIDDDEIWHFSHKLDFLKKIDFKTAETRKYTAADFEIPPGRRADFPNIYGAIYRVGGQYYYELTGIPKDRALLLKLDQQSGRFKLVEKMPLDAEEAKVFGDKMGNVVFLFRFPNGEYQAILEDSDGRRYDYSAFFKTSLLWGAGVRALKSPDFKRQLLICHTKGILLQTVKASDAIQHILPQFSIRAMVELPGRHIMIATQAKDAEFLFNAQTGTLETWKSPECYMGWAKLVKDKAGFIWGAGKSAFIKYDPATNSCEKYPVSMQRNLFAFVGDNTIAYFQQEYPDYLSLFDLEQGTSSIFTIDGEPLTIQDYVHDMLYSRSGLLWIATTKGMVKVDVERHASEVIGLAKPFLDFRFMCIHEDEKGRLWLGTPLGGIHIYNPVTGELKILNSDKGLGNNTVASIVADDDGNRWVGTYNGVSIVSPEGELIANLYEEDGLVDEECNRYSCLKTSDGKILIGTVNGLNIIDPKKIKERLTDSKNLKIYLTAISYFDAGEKEQITQSAGLGNLGTITLPASSRNIRLKFALSNYFKPEYNQYAYQLEGISGDWVPLGSRHTLNLNNMPAGRYRLLVRGSDGSGNWTTEPLAVSIRARELFYKQIWFYLLCLAALGGLSFLWIQRLRLEVKKATRTIREDKETIERQAEELKELDEAKARFFTNISHEFRTPLTIISGMVDQVRSKPGDWMEKGTKIIKQNTLILLNLINQILDLRKLESKNLKLNLMQGDIVQYLRYLSESYQSYAENEGMQLHFLSATPTIVMDYDPDKILRIVSNLLANAIKYNRKGGHIYFQAEKTGELDDSGWLRLRIQDTGEGIPKEKLPDIFSLYYQGHQPGEKKAVGSGIGLALTSELVKLMNGEIEVESEVGVGTTFIVRLPVTRAAEQRDALFAPAEPVLAEEVLAPVARVENVPPAQESTQGSDELPTLLIVEDNPQIVQILIACLEDHYHLEIAANGQKGIDRAIELIPDIIISDVMMPEKDGYELTNALKNDERTGHIPIVLLTAKSDLESKISGLEKGADAYLAKPFEQRELLVRLEKLLELRKRLQARYAQFSKDDGSPEIEDPFLQKFYSLVEQEISNPELDMNQLCRGLAMSRSQVFRKLKALTGTSPTLFIRSIRLKQGRELLKNSGLTVSEVAYDVGFTSLSYFSNAFFEEFGERPSATHK